MSALLLCLVTTAWSNVAQGPVAPTAAEAWSSPSEQAEPPHAFAAGELAVTTEVAPRAPAYVPAEVAAGQTCDAVVTVDPLGVPTDVSVEGCHVHLMGATMRTLLRWRFEAPRVDGHAVAATVPLTITY